MSILNTTGPRRLKLIGTIVFWATITVSQAQTTWTGIESTAWNTAGNWSAGVSDAADAVTIPDVTNDPVVSAAGAVAKSVTVQSGGLLTISASGVLNINGSVASGFANQGTVQNNGTINIGNTSAVAGNGIHNKGTFNNNAAASITIDRAGTGIYNDYGTFNCAGTIIMGATAGGEYGLNNFHGNFNINVGGLISISNAGSGIRFIYGVITNSGSIIIGPLGSATMNEGMLLFFGNLVNNTGGQININRVSTAIANFDASIANAGTFSIGTETAVTNLFATDQDGSGLFNNNTGGLFKAAGTVPAAKFTNAGGTVAPGNPLGELIFTASEDFTNSILSMDVNVTITVGVVNHDHIEVNGTATLGGTLNLSFNILTLRTIACGKPCLCGFRC